MCRGLGGHLSPVSEHPKGTTAADPDQAGWAPAVSSRCGGGGGGLVNNLAPFGGGGGVPHTHTHTHTRPTPRGLRPIKRCLSGSLDPPFCLAPFAPPETQHHRRAPGGGGGLDPPTPPSPPPQKGPCGAVGVLAHMHSPPTHRLPPGGSVDTTKTRLGPQRVRMSGGERPRGAARDKQSDTGALCQPSPPPRPRPRTRGVTPPPPRGHSPTTPQPHNPHPMSQRSA